MRNLICSYEHDLNIRQILEKCNEYFGTFSDPVGIIQMSGEIKGEVFNPAAVVVPKTELPAYTEYTHGMRCTKYSRI